MTKFLSLAVPGAVAGAIYSIIASSLVLTYQATGVFQFGQGAVAFAIALLFYQLNTGFGWPIVPAAIVSILFAAPLFGLLLDKVLFRRLSTAPVYARIVGTIGLAVALPPLCWWLVEGIGNGVFDLGLPTESDTTGQTGLAGLGPNPPKTFKPLDGVVINSNQIAVFVLAAIAAVVLWFVVNRMRLGLEMRAMVDKRDLAALRGIDAARVSASSWMLSFLLAGATGVLISPIFGLDSRGYVTIVFGALAAVAVSGLRSVPVAFVGGLGLGVLQNLLVGYGDVVIPDTILDLAGFRSSVPFVITVVVLMVSGRQRGRSAGSVADERPVPDHRDGLPAWRRIAPWAVFIVLLVVYSQGAIDAFRAPRFWAGLLAKGIVLAIVFLSFVVVTGVGGMVSLAQATFVTAGGFSAGWAVNQHWGADIPILTTNGRTNFFVGALLAAAVAALVGALVAIPVRRMGALALALATLALALAADLVVFQIDSIRNEDAGWTINAPIIGPYDLGLFHLGPWNLRQPRIMVLVALAVFAVITLMIRNLQRSHFGRAALAVRSSEVATGSVGVRPAQIKIVLFAFSAAIAGFGGALFGVINSPVSSTSTPAFIGLVWLAVTVTWGIRRPGGALLAGIVFALSEQLLDRAADWSFWPSSVSDLLGLSYFSAMLFGLGAIQLAQNPDGVLALVGQHRSERRTRDRSTVRARDVDSPTTSPPTTIDRDATLVVERVHAGYGDVEVLRGVSLSVGAGTITAVLGPNGAGKSTLCNAVGGLVAVREGTITIAGVDRTLELAHQRARRGVLVVPEARGVFPGLSVEDNLRLRLRTSAQIDDAYARFPILGERRRQTAGLLSGGEQQMLSIVIALADPPTVFVADEPTLGLAPMIAAQVYAALAVLRDRGVAVLCAEEKTNEALAHADRVAIMRLGTVTWEGPASAITRDQLAAAYLGGVGDATAGQQDASTARTGANKE